MRRSFTFNPEFCLLDTNFKKPRHICLFDTWSAHHFFWQGVAYILLHELFEIKDIKHSIFLGLILTSIHIGEEYLGNTSRTSLEGIVIDNLGPLVDPKLKPEKRKIDNDYFDNSIGDVLSGFISNVLIILFWYKFGKLPYFYFLLSIPIGLNLLSNTKKYH